MLELKNVTDGENLSRTKELFLEYQKYLGIDLCFQNFDKELESLPGDYAPPGGGLLLVWYDSKVAGCVALRQIDLEVCEMKRMYVKPGFRGKGIGRKLALAIIEEALKIGYKKMKTKTHSPPAGRKKKNLSFSTNFYFKKRLKPIVTIQ